MRVWLRLVQILHPVSFLTRSISPDADTSTFQRSICRILRWQGWSVDDRDFGDQVKIARRGLSARVFFLPEHATVFKTTEYDWVEARALSQMPIIVVTGKQLTALETKSATESLIAFCYYTDLDKIEHICYQFTMEEETRRQLGFSGVVDAFEEPATLRGWVRLRTEKGLSQLHTISVLKRGVVLATVQPDHTRPDVSGNATYLAGFKVDCGTGFSQTDLLDEKINVIAYDTDGRVHHLTVWDKVLSDIRLSVDKKISATFSNSAIARLISVGDRGAYIDRN